MSPNLLVKAIRDINKQDKYKELNFEEMKDKRFYTELLSLKEKIKITELPTANFIYPKWFTFFDKNYIKDLTVNKGYIL